MTFRTKQGRRRIVYDGM